MRSKSLKILKKHLVLAMLLPFIYSAFVLFFVWWHCYFSHFKGGKNGQLDAYRHTLASAVVAYTISPKVVTLVSLIMEQKNLPANIMDKHNNAIGAQIGVKASSLDELGNYVEMRVLQGSVNTPSSTQITWMPAQTWRESLWW